jgi:hypothetical protein
MSQRPAWQYALFVGTSSWLVAMLGVTLIDRLTAHHAEPGWGIFSMSVCVASTTIGQTWRRQERSKRRGSRPRYGDPGPMLPYAGLAPGSDIDGPKGR